MASAAAQATAMPPSDRSFVARWTLDLSRVGALIATLEDDPAPGAGWIESLLNGARITDLDERAAQVVGAPVGREQMIGQPVASFAPPDSWATLARLIVAVATDRAAHASRSAPINSFMLQDAMLRIWGGETGRISTTIEVAVEGIIADDRSPWAVRASEERYKRLIHHLPTALLQVDARGLDELFQTLRADGVIDIKPFLGDHTALVRATRDVVRVTDANEGAVKLFRAPGPDALIGPVDYLFTTCPEAARRVIVAHFEGQRSHSEQIRLRAFDGTLLDVQLSVTYPNSPERLDVTLVSLEDVTDRLRTERQLRQVQSDYGRAARIATLGELASSIAHEVNQPLAAIAMNAETSLRWLSREEPNIQKAAQLTARIAASARHASEIVQRIRGMAALQAPRRTRLDLNEVVEEALLFVRHDLDSKGIRLTSIAAGSLPHVCGDRVQLQQVIVNLLVNAIQALAQMDEAPRRIQLRTGIDADGSVTFSIVDSGPGIAEENLDRIFDGFFTTKEDGMGIGLAVCQSIILSLGGTIVASNDSTGGARFSFALPQASPSADPECVSSAGTPAGPR